MCRTFTQQTFSSIVWISFCRSDQFKNDLPPPNWSKQSTFEAQCHNHFNCYTRTVVRKFSIKGLCCSAGGICVLCGELDIKKLTKIHWLIVFHVSISGGVELCLEVFSPPMAHVAMWLCCTTSKFHTVYTCGSQSLFWEPHAAPKHPLCSPQQSFNKTSMFYATDFVLQSNKTCQLTCVNFLFGSLTKSCMSGLSPTSEKVKNHLYCAGAAGMPWLRDVRKWIAHSCCASYVVSKAVRKHSLAIILVLENIKIYYPKYKSLISLLTQFGWLLDSVLRFSKCQQ